jgi:CBS domain containing-hemolysin-like protein
MENASQMLAAAQLTITVCSLGLGALAEPAIAHLLEAPFEAVHMPEAATHVVAFALGMSLVVYLHIVLGEMVPKNLSLAAPERAALILAPMLVAVVRLFRPFIWLVNALAGAVLSLFKVEQRDEVASTFNAEEVASLVSESRREGLLDKDEHELLTGALDFEGETVMSVLLPVASLVMVAEASTSADVEEVVVRTGYSRFPVARRSGELAGYLHLKDVLEIDPAKRDRPIASKWIRPMASVSPNDSLRVVLSAMQKRGSHMARVVKVDGEVLGVVTLEDVLEELVGEVRDATQAAINDES